ncbi:MAG: hypothetical protein S4CHLAM20_03630 [Chlamydiia bacterium]|nr:hypothetical protein [Chlamydiia bacterium]
MSILTLISIASDTNNAFDTTESPQKFSTPSGQATESAEKVTHVAQGSGALDPDNKIVGFKFSKEPIEIDRQSTTNLVYLSKLPLGMNKSDYNEDIDRCVQVLHAYPKSENLIFSAFGKRHYSDMPTAKFFMLAQAITYLGKPYYTFMEVSNGFENDLIEVQRKDQLPQFDYLFEWNEKENTVSLLTFSSKGKRYNAEFTFEEFQSRCNRPNAFDFEPEPSSCIESESTIDCSTKSQGLNNSHPVFVENKNLNIVLFRLNGNAFTARRIALNKHAKNLNLKETEAIYVNRDFKIVDLPADQRETYHNYEVGTIIVDSSFIRVVVLSHDKIKRARSTPKALSMETIFDTFKDKKAIRGKIVKVKMNYTFDFLTQYINLSLDFLEDIIDGIISIANNMSSKLKDGKFILIGESFLAVQSSNKEATMVQVGVVEIADRKSKAMKQTIKVMKQISQEEKGLLEICNTFCPSKSSK